MTAGPGAGRTPTLDGLRGIAVIAVVIEHAWPTLLPGGFAGVDVFFVLSGFLITRMLLGEIGRTGTVDLVAFYARRVRRIIPAATACVILVAILFTVVLGVGFGRGFRTEALSAALSVSNLLFVSRATDYFAADPASSPFLHYWSLAVEEQFYLFWPTLLLALVAAGQWAARRSGGRGGAGPDARIARWLPIALTAGVAVISFALTLSSSQTTAFFLLPHRAWELLVGGLLAWLQLTVAWSPRRGLAALRWMLAVAGVAALAATFTVEFERWPGIATTLPVVGTVALIAGGTSIPGARWLSAGWLRFFGRISYALYLWHWPLLAAATVVALPAAHPPVWMTALAVALAIGAASASTFLLEEPIRFAPTRWLARFRALAAAAAFVALASVTVVLTTSVPPAEAALPPGPQATPSGGLPAPSASGGVVPATAPDILSQLRSIPDDHERIIDEQCVTTTEESVVRRCVYGAAARADGGPATDVPAGMPVAVLYGDSHAMHWFPAVNAWATETGMALVPLTRSGCPAVDADVTGDPEAVQQCRDWRAGAFKRMAELDVAITIVSSSSAVRVVIDGTVLSPRRVADPWIEPAARFLRQLATVSRTVVYIADVPRPGFLVPDCLAAHRRDIAACALPVAEVQPAAFMAAQVAMAAAAGATFVDPTPWLCPDGTCSWLVGGRIAFRDDSHMTASASGLLAGPLGPLLDAAVAGAPAAPAAGP